MAVAGDVPEKFDVVINGQGYMLAPLDQGIPPSIFGLKSEYSYTPTFIPRSNVSGDFGDNQQDFWMTATQRDWELGEQQRYFRSSDADSVRRYWQGSGVDLRIPGQVSMRAAVSSVTSTGTAFTTITDRYQAGGTDGIAVATVTKLYTISNALALTDQGAHGLGTGPSLWGMCTDGGNIFLSTTSGGTVGVRKWTGAAFSTFSASAADSLAFVNNTLYGLRSSAGDLVRWDIAGTLTSIFTWKDAAGNAIPLSDPLGMSKVIPFGGKLAILRTYIPGSTSNPASTSGELWIYDGTSVSLIARFPQGFLAFDLEESLGQLFVSGTMPLASGSSIVTSPCIYFYSNGSTGLLWRSYASSAQAPALKSWNNGLLFSDPARSALMFYDATTGGVQTLSTGWTSAGPSRIGANGRIAVAADGTATSYAFRDSASAATSATITTSLFDLESSLGKLFRGIKVEFDSATDGNGGTVDIAYRVGDVDGSYTNLQTTAVSGTEYPITGVTGRSISVKVTLNKGTSTNGPVLKRIAVRAVQQQPSFRKGSYILELTGKRKRGPMEGQMMILRDGTTHTKDAAQMVADLIAAATSATPFSITDSVNGTISSAVGDLSEFVISQTRPETWICKFAWREA